MRASIASRAVFLLLITSFVYSCASHGPARPATGDPGWALGSALNDAKRAIGFTDASEVRQGLLSGSKAGFTFDFAEQAPIVAAAARATLSDFGLHMVTDEPKDAGTLMVAETGINVRGLGELVGLTITPLAAGGSRVLMVSQKRIGIAVFEKDWTSDILAGIKSRLFRGSITVVQRPAPAVTTFSFSFGQGKPPATSPWLSAVADMVGQAFRGIQAPALIVVCEGKSGDYLTDRIVSTLGSSRKDIRIVASGKDLDRTLREQERAVSGVYDEATTVEVGKLKGAHYAFYGTPYIKRSAGVVELACKILDIETGVLLDAGRIITLPISELPEE